MWDANERVDHHKSKLLSFMTKTSLAPLHITLPEATYARGTTCIDYIMATPGVRAATVAAGYTSFYEGIWHSDHWGVFIDISTQHLFLGSTPDMENRPERHVSSNNKKQVFRFIKALEDLDCLPNMLSELEHLTSQPIWSTIEHDKLDPSIFNSLKHSFKPNRHVLFHTKPIGIPSSTTATLSSDTGK
jgi:hypothetical protein